MFERFAKSVSKAAAVVSGKEILSEQGKEKLRALSAQIETQIKSLQIKRLEEGEVESLAEDKGKAPDRIHSREEKEALRILHKVKALLDKLVTLNSWQLMALGSLESVPVDPNKAIDDLSLEELVQDLLLNRDIYWDIKNKLLHQNLAQLFTALKELTLTDFSEAGTGVLYTIGGVEKIHAVGIILSSLLPFYDITQSRPGVSSSQYHPDVDGRLLPNFRQELYVLQDAFLFEIGNAKTGEEKGQLLSQYKEKYDKKIKAFLVMVHDLPGEAIFLEAKNTDFNPHSVISFRPQGGILKGLLLTESCLNSDLAAKCKGILSEPLLTTVYEDITNHLDQGAIRKPREDLFAMVTSVIIEKFQQYIKENETEKSLTKAKVNLLQNFLEQFIFGRGDKGREVFVNKGGEWRTADNYGERGQLYTCAEIATKLLAELIVVLKEHDKMCKQANRGVGRTGLLLAHAIAAATEYLSIPYDRRVDDSFLSELTRYKREMSNSFAPQQQHEAQSSSMSLKG